jgi:hypothetical protein
MNDLVCKHLAGWKSENYDEHGRPKMWWEFEDDEEEQEIPF